MGNTIEISNAEIDALARLAEVSGMDCWFGITIDGTIYDRENGVKFVDVRNAIHDLIDGASEYDIQQIGHYNSLAIMNLMARLMIAKI